MVAQGMRPRKTGEILSAKLKEEEMLNLIVELGQLASLAALAYGALLCVAHSDLFQTISGRNQEPQS
jgi:hypothetical protein